MKTRTIKIKRGWKFKKIAENGDIILEKIEPKLPKSWEECYKQLNEGEFINSISEIVYLRELKHATCDMKTTLPVGLGKPLLALMQLLVCREIYRKGWKPNWNDLTEQKHCISFDKEKIRIHGAVIGQRILSFQSKEVRDKFLENFRDLIEEANELI